MRLAMLFFSDLDDTMVCLTESTVYIRTKCTVEAVKKLNLWGCDIDDISICERMVNIEVLSLSVNRVETLQSLRNCTRLVELYLRKNNIQSLTELEYLKDLHNLRVLWIDENPCTSGGDYRHRVLRILPQLTKLDDRPVTLDDHMEAQQDDSAPECDMHASMISLQSVRSSRSSSLYAPGRAIIDTVMQPQMVSYGDASDEERLPPPRDPQAMRLSRLNLMSQSMHPSLMTQSIYEPSNEERDEEWGDFSLEEDTRPTSMDSIANRMCMSVYETTRRAPSTSYSRSASAPRRRLHHRKESRSPARDIRLDKIMSAVSVLLDELDAEGLRAVIEQAQDRMKKRW
ncbi:unnamed protein product [Heligmosomoides polygyrus]|uniref:U2A'/phosphoprotein 32 family A C-terminal domain-containing protein n=1 Tax=Heligmosomoides polygyrus TaxID=6339 RepID=A0A3P7ZTP4_HELPZ|nr:unnamed protein product [Heligmosomoides polygyrus]